MVTHFRGPYNLDQFSVGDFIFGALKFQSISQRNLFESGIFVKSIGNLIFVSKNLMFCRGSILFNNRFRNKHNVACRYLHKT